MADRPQVLERLAGALPPPWQPVAAEVDWQRFKRENRLSLPADFMLFAETYGAGVLQTEVDWPVRFTPVQAGEFTFTEHTAYTRRSFGREWAPWPVWPEDGGFLPWAELMDDFGLLGWLTSGDPESWQVAAWGFGTEEILTTSAVETILAIVEGRVLEGLVDPTSPPLFVPGVPPPFARPDRQKADVEVSVLGSGWSYNTFGSGVLEADRDLQWPAHAGLTSAGAEGLPGRYFLHVEFNPEDGEAVRGTVAQLVERLGVAVLQTVDWDGSPIWTDLSDQPG